MVDDPQGSARFSLRRWSQRKLAAGRGDGPQRDDRQHVDNAAAADPAASAIPAVSSPAGDPMAPSATQPVEAPPMLPQRQAAPAGRIPLPPLESLTIESDFSPFMQPGVDEAVKRKALRTLLRHPRFNVMDGLDVYIDDYSKPSPLEPELARALMQARYIFDPPKTRVTADGTVEDIPDDAVDPIADDAAMQVPDAAASAPGADAIAQAPGDRVAESRVPVTEPSTNGSTQ